MAANIPKDKLLEYRECFDLFDLNKDNKISSKELRNMMENLGQQPSDEELHTIMVKADLNKNGFIDFDEFCLVMEEFMRPQSFEQQLRDAFKVIDRDGSGKIDAAEFKKILHNIGDKVNDAEMNEIIREIDMDGDGEVDFEEFVKIAVSAKH